MKDEQRLSPAAESCLRAIDAERWRDAPLDMCRQLANMGLTIVKQVPLDPMAVDVRLTRKGKDYLAEHDPELR